MPPVERPQRRLARGLIAATFVVLAGRLLVSPPVDRVGWVASDQAPARAAESGKPILYDFTAEWCEPCRQMSREVFADPEVARRIDAQYVPVRVLDRQLEDGRNSPAVAELQSRFGVDSFPALIVADAEGKVLARIQGARPRARVLEFLHTHARR